MLTASLAGWLVIVVALVAANLPFVSERLFGIFARAGRRKPIALRLLELLVLYFLVGAFAWLLESRIGNVFAQRWEFYAISLCLFLVLAFPGFVWTTLRRRG